MEQWSRGKLRTGHTDGVGQRPASESGMIPDHSFEP